MKSRPKWAGTLSYCIEEELGRTTLTVTVLIVFVCLVLATLLLLVRIVLAGLLTGLTLPVLAGLTTMLTLSGLVALLTFFLHIVCHKEVLLDKAQLSAPFFGFEVVLKLSCCTMLQRLGTNHFRKFSQ
jgi:preprotein translocase subunit Sec61beta